MKLVWIIGDSAVGKMTVGQELMKITNLRLFHNHMMIEPVLEIFGEFRGSTISRLKDIIFEEFAASNQYGMIHTFMWAFDTPSDWDYVRRISQMFADRGATLYYVELVAPQEVRLVRNATENRLQHKASKRDIEQSNQRLLNDDARYRCVSYEGEIPYPNYLKIDNTNLSATETAQMIQKYFDL